MDRPATPEQSDSSAGTNTARACIAFFTLLLIGGSRFLVRSVVEKPMRGYRLPSGREILIVGAGDGGQMVAREIDRKSVV